MRFLVNNNIATFKWRPLLELHRFILTLLVGLCHTGGHTKIFPLSQFFLKDKTVLIF